MSLCKKLRKNQRNRKLNFCSKNLIFDTIVYYMKNIHLIKSIFEFNSFKRNYNFTEKKYYELRCVLSYKKNV